MLRLKIFFENLAKFNFSLANEPDFEPQPAEKLVSQADLGIFRHNFKRADRYLDFRSMTPEDIFRIARCSESQLGWPLNLFKIFEKSYNFF